MAKNYQVFEAPLTISDLQLASKKLSSMILVSLGLKGTGFRFENGNILWAQDKKICLNAHDWIHYIARALDCQQDKMRCDYMKLLFYHLLAAAVCCVLWQLQSVAASSVKEAVS